MPQPMHRGAPHIAFGELPILRFPRLPFAARLPTQRPPRILLFALRRLVRLPEVGNQIGTFFLVRHAGVAHRRSRDGLYRVRQKEVERFFVPDNFRSFHRVGICKALHAARAATEEAAMSGAGSVVGECMAGEAARINRLAGLDICARR
jgi:hypothetical protein